MSQAVRETQKDEGKTLPMPEEFVPLYHQPAKKKTNDKREPTKAKINTDIKKAIRVDKIFREVFKQPKANNY